MFYCLGERRARGNILYNFKLLLREMFIFIMGYALFFTTGVILMEIALFLFRTLIIMNDMALFAIFLAPGI